MMFKKISIFMLISNLTIITGCVSSTGGTQNCKRIAAYDALYESESKREKLQDYSMEQKYEILKYGKEIIKKQFTKFSCTKATHFG